MDSKELRLFREAYGSVYSTQKEETVAEEQVDEGAGIVTGAAKAINAVMKPVGQTPEQGAKAVSNLTKAMDKVAKPIKTGIKAVLSTGGKAITAGGGTPDTQRIDNEARRLGRDAMRRSGKYEDADLFDIVKGHLLDEGYADTEEAALAIMANMSEEWRQSIIESGYFPTPESQREDEKKYNLSRDRLPGEHKPQKPQKPQSQKPGM